MPCCGGGSWIAFPRLLRDWKTISFVFVQFSFKLISVAQDSRQFVGACHGIDRWNNQIGVVGKLQYFVGVMYRTQMGCSDQIGCRTWQSPG